MTARKLRALIANAGPTPNAPMARPAAAGPMTRAPLNIAELRATALPTSSRPTSSMANDCRTGMSTAVGDPEQEREHEDHPDLDDAADDEDREDRGQDHHRDLGPDQDAPLRQRVGGDPANSPRTMTGMNCAAATTPSQIGSWVSSRTSQAWATCCIQVPTSEIAWPEKNSR